MSPPRRSDRRDHARLATFHNGAESGCGGKAVSDPDRHRQWLCAYA